MADEHWFLLIVRLGFETVVAQKLRRLNFEVVVPDKNCADGQQVRFRALPSTAHVYCRFALEDRTSIISIPGVLDILGAPKLTPVIPVSQSCLQLTSRSN